MLVLVVIALWLLAGVAVFLYLRLRTLRMHLQTLLEQNRMLQTMVENGDRQFALLFDASPDAIVTSDLEGKITSVNSATLRIFQYAEASQLLGRPILDFVHVDDREKAMANLSDMYHGKYNGPEDYRSIRADGSIVDMSVNAEFTTDSQGVRNGFLFIERDVSARRAYESALAENNRRLESLSNTDGLTELPNRRYFDDFWRRECSRSMRSQGDLALLFADVDFFKQYNDYYGHQKGDECLHTVAQALAGVLSRPADLVARYGGEEFVCALPETDLAGAEFIAEKMRLAVQRMAIPHAMSEASKVVTISLGVAGMRCGLATPPEVLLQTADEMLYKAKQLGRNRFCSEKALFEESRQHHSMQALQWEVSYESGNRRIDLEHRELFRLANWLMDCIVREDSEDEIGQSLDTLLMELQRHFQNEEAVLQAVGYGDLPEHTNEHLRLLQKAEACMREYYAKKLDARGLLEFIAQDVVKMHMLGMDRMYFASLAESQIRSIAVL